MNSYKNANSFLVLAFLCFFQMNGQGYLPFPATGASWKMHCGYSRLPHVSGYPTFSNSFVTFSVVGDTLFNGYSWKIIRGDLATIDTVPFLPLPGATFYIRIDSVNANSFVWENSVERNVYNISKEAGENWIIQKPVPLLFFDCYGISDFQYWVDNAAPVSAVDTVSMGGLLRKRITPGFAGSNGAVYEGIGWLGYTNYTYDAGQYDVSYGTRVYQYCENGQAIYIDYAFIDNFNAVNFFPAHFPKLSIDCNLIVGDEKPVSGKQVKLYPNPGSSKVYLEFPPGKTMEGKLYSYDGKGILSFSSGNGKSEIETSTLPSGIYFFRMLTEGEGEVILKWMKVN